MCSMRFLKALFLMIILPQATPLRHHIPNDPSLELRSSPNKVQAKKTLSIEIQSRRAIVLSGLISIIPLVVVKPVWSGGWQDYKPAPEGSTTSEIARSATEKATTLLIETIPVNADNALPLSDAREMARNCYTECFEKFGDSLVPATEYDISVYCTSRCFESVATAAFGLERGSAAFCQAYADATQLEFFGCP